MVPSARPIKNIHVSAFDGSRSFWSRWITHASDYRSRQKRLQMPSENPHCTVYTPLQGPEMVSSAPALPLRSLPSFRHLVIWPLRRAFHTTTPSSSPHRHALSLTRAPHPLLLRARAPHPPLFLPPLLPLSLAASAPFFAPLPPPIRTPYKSRCTDVRFFPPCVSRPSPFPPPVPAGVFTHLLFIS